MHPLSGATRSPPGTPSPCLMHSTPFSQPGQGQGGDAPPIPGTTGQVLPRSYGAAWTGGALQPSMPDPSTSLRVCDKTGLGTSRPYGGSVLRGCCSHGQYAFGPPMPPSPLTVRGDRGPEPLAHTGRQGDELPVRAKRNFFWICACTKPGGRYNEKRGEEASQLHTHRDAGVMFRTPRTMLSCRPSSGHGAIVPSTQDSRTSPVGVTVQKRAGFLLAWAPVTFTMPLGVGGVRIGLVPTSPDCAEHLAPPGRWSITLGRERSR